MKKFFFLFFVFIFFNSAFSQNQFNFNIDYSTFRYDSSSCYVEFYYSYPQNQLSLLSADSVLFVNGLLSINLTDTVTKKNVLERNWKITNTLSDSNDIVKNNSLIGQIGFIIPKGVYSAYIVGADGGNNKVFREYSFNINVRPYQSSNLMISNIQLATNIKYDNADEKSIFYKNSLEVIPNPTAIFGEKYPMLFYYCEIYNLDKFTSEPKTKITTSVYDTNNKKIYQRTKLISTSSQARVDIGTINVSKFSTGKYSLIISISDSVKKTGAVSSKPFFVFNPAIQQKVEESEIIGKAASSEFGSLSDEECEDLFEKSKYIATETEIEQYEALSTVEAKREFLFSFWKKRDPDRTTAQNEFYAIYLKRIEYSNERFGALNRTGWKTDRGRVFLMYGEPNQIDRFPSQVDTKPYEIWNYDKLQGGVIFVFADLTGFSDYVLLHSTLRGEIKDENWQKRLSAGF